MFIYTINYLSDYQSKIIFPLTSKKYIIRIEERYICINMIFYKMFIVSFAMYQTSSCADQNCTDEDCTDTIDIPLTDKINAPLKVELDIRQLIKELKVVIKSEVKRGVTIAMEDHVDSVIADKVKDLKKHLITNNTDNGGLSNHYIKGKSVNDSMLLILPEHLGSTPVFSGVRVTRSLVICVNFVDHCLSFFFCHCVVCPSAIYGF